MRGWLKPMASSPARAQSLKGPETSVSTPSCSGAATVVVIWKTAHITAKNSNGPATASRWWERGVACSTSLTEAFAAGPTDWPWLSATSVLVSAMMSR